MGSIVRDSQPLLQLRRQWNRNSSIPRASQQTDLILTLAADNSDLHSVALSRAECMSKVAVPPDSPSRFKKAVKKLLVPAVSLLAMSKAFSATAFTLFTSNDFGLAIRNFTQVS
ncbi:hypothetical protein OIU85_019700 [Salix viminalis]|uniref:Uncharacterized protein n=1 Tax=Salix viminalis TaxID=40686 RepID=A0A9Q0ZKD3_SALVM|nr:hypothetical protein OIU85_019700 [Salix viminalis]